jgi:hypothetical protein
MRQGGTLKGGRQWCRPRARENGLARGEPLPDRVCLCTCQALTTCGKPGDVLRLLDEFRQRQQVVSASGRVWHRLLS